jgi:hypothetical protein
VNASSIEKKAYVALLKMLKHGSDSSCLSIFEKMAGFCIFQIWCSVIRRASHGDKTLQQQMAAALGLEPALRRPGAGMNPRKVSLTPAL